MNDELIFLSMFSVAAVVAVLSKRLKVPYTIALVLAGLALGTADSFEPPHLTKELLFAIFLPGLIFEAAFHLELRRFLANKWSILALAIPGVAAATALTAVLITWVAPASGFGAGFLFIHALVFASLISATDPIAVVALFKTLGAPKRLAVLVEGESLLNDGVAVVFFTLIVGAANGGELTVGSAFVDFVQTVGLGLVVGSIAGFAASRAIHHVNDPTVEITVTTVAAYGSFAVAEHFHGSGVIATVVAGMLCGNYAARSGMSPSTRIAVESFWEYFAFVLNSFVFLLIGLEVELAQLLEHWLAIVVGWLAVTGGRAVVIAVATAALSRTKEKISWKYSAVLTWGGLRGALSMVLVLGLAPDFPHRQVLIDVTFGVVLLSILLQGMLMAPLLSWLGVTGGRHDRDEYEARRGAVLAAAGAIAALDRMGAEKFAKKQVLQGLRDDYNERLKHAEAEMESFQDKHRSIDSEEREAGSRHLLHVEKKEVQSAYAQGVLSSEALERLLADIDGRLMAIERGHDEE